MPRRRMISPEFWKDSDIRKLTREERLFFIGCISHADDDGRLMGHPAYLKAAIFMYDDDLTLDGVKKLRDSMLAKVRNLVLYTNAGEEYLAFSKWPKHQKPSRPTPSDFPAPPQRITEPLTEPLRENITEAVIETVSETLKGQSRSGQSSLGKVSIGKGEFSEDFTEFLDNEKDLTDFLTKTLTLHMSSAGERLTSQRAAQLGMPVLAKFWEQVAGTKLAGVIWQGAYDALQKYPVEWIAIAFVKAGPYQGGKYKSWKYFQAIIDEEMKKHKPTARSP